MGDPTWSYQGQDMLEPRRGAQGPCSWLLAPALLAGLSLPVCKHLPTCHICYNVLRSMPRQPLSPLARLWHLLAPDTQALPHSLTRTLGGRVAPSRSQGNEAIAGGNRPGTDALLKHVYARGGVTPGRTKRGRTMEAAGGREMAVLERGRFCRQVGEAF